MVEGRLTLDQWTAQDGQKRSKHRVTVESFQFLPAGGRSSEQGSPADEGSQIPSENTGPANDIQNGRKDDIPF
jgi:single-strand DNA-binding protein